MNDILTIILTVVCAMGGMCIVTAVPTIAIAAILYAEHRAKLPVNLMAQQKETVMTKKVNPAQMTVGELRLYVISPEGQKVITAFEEEKLALINSQPLYLAVCQAAEANRVPLTAETIREIRRRQSQFREGASPAHDGPHWDRDGLGALAIRRDPRVLKAMFMSDVDAGILGAFLHDTGTSVIARYTDKNYAMGHCEIGAWIIWHMLEDVLEPNLLLLVWYAVNGHQHFLKDTGVAPDSSKQPTYTRQQHVIEPFYLPEDEKKEHVVGLAPYMTRTADRFENCMQWVRHIMAQADAQEQDNPGEWDGAQVIETKGAKRLLAMMRPEYRVVRGGDPTLADWIIGVYGHSFHGAGPYSIHDKAFPVVDYIFDRKLARGFQVIELMDEMPDMSAFSEEKVRAQFKALLRRVNGSVHLTRSWSHLMIAWEALSREERAKWGRIFTLLDTNFTKDLNLLMRFATEVDDEWSILARELYEEVL